MSERSINGIFAGRLEKGDIVYFAEGENLGSPEKGPQVTKKGTIVAANRDGRQFPIVRRWADPDRGPDGGAETGFYSRRLFKPDEVACAVVRRMARQRRLASLAAMTLTEILNDHQASELLAGVLRDAAEDRPIEADLSQ